MAVTQLGPESSRAGARRARALAARAGGPTVALVALSTVTVTSLVAIAFAPLPHAVSPSGASGGGGVAAPANVRPFVTPTKSVQHHSTAPVTKKTGTPPAGTAFAGTTTGTTTGHTHSSTTHHPQHSSGGSKGGSGGSSGGSGGSGGGTTGPTRPGSGTGAGGSTHGGTGTGTEGSPIPGGGTDPNCPGTLAPAGDPVSQVGPICVIGGIIGGSGTPTGLHPGGGGVVVIPRIPVVKPTPGGTSKPVASIVKPVIPIGPIAPIVKHPQHGDHSALPSTLTRAAVKAARKGTTAASTTSSAAVVASVVASVVTPDVKGQGSTVVTDGHGRGDHSGSPCAGKHRDRTRGAHLAGGKHRS